MKASGGIMVINTSRLWIGMAVLGSLCGGGIAEAKTDRVGHQDREVVDVEDVFQTDEGHYVVLLKTDRAPTRYLRIWIAQREALAIRLRLERQSPPRPLTLNLTESILKSSKSTLQSVFIDDYQGGVFLGEIRLKQRGRVWTLDARPSDAIALALGQEVPIWVAREVLDKVGFELSPKPRPVAPTPEVPVAAREESHLETL